MAEPAPLGYDPSEVPESKFPVAVNPNPTQIDPCLGQAPREVEPVTPHMQAEAERLYLEFKPLATNAYFSYFMTSTPPQLVPIMRELIAADIPGQETPPPTDTVVSNGASVVVTDALGVAVAGSPGVAEVAGSVLTGVKLSV